MLDSDSDFEYPDVAGGGAQSDGSTDDLLVGKIALGVDQVDMRSYDGRSTPKNGSQYLMKVMAEKKFVPKVAYADPSKLPVVLVTKAAVPEKSDPINPNYLERFLQMCSAYEGEGKLANANSKLLPSAKWREQGISSFSKVRLNVDRWKYRLEAKEIVLDRSAELPRGRNHLHWRKFCYGSSFAKFASSCKLKTPEGKLADFFLDLYDSSTTFEEQLNTSMTTALETSSICDGVFSSDGGGGDLTKHEVTDSDNASGSMGADNAARKSIALLLQNETDKDETNSTDLAPVLTPSKPSVANQTNDEENCTETFMLGHRPFMNLVLSLSQVELEDLVKWNLMWLRDVGFANECQGQWLYAILACLGKPIEPTVMSDLRSIARILIALRNSVSKWNSHFDNESDCDNNSGAISSSGVVIDEKIFDFINTLNLFIYIVTDYFQQKDLIMHL